MRRFENTSGGHNKFWEVEIVQNAGSWMVNTRWGKIGTAGQTLEKKFAHQASAIGEEKFGVQKRLDHGYHEVTATANKVQVYSAPPSAPKYVVTPPKKPAPPVQAKPQPTPQMDDDLGFIDLLD